MDADAIIEALKERLEEVTNEKDRIESMLNSHAPKPIAGKTSSWWTPARRAAQSRRLKAAHRRRRTPQQ